MSLTAKTVMEIIQHEGLVREAYRDSVGVLTWSIGITSASGHRVDRYKNNPQSLRRCLEVYIWLLETKYLPAVERAFKGRELSEHQLAAALSFHYNTGGIARASWVKSFMKGDGEKAHRQFMAWSKPKEIIPRRKKERDLFFDGEWVGGKHLTEYTKVTSSGQIVWSSARRVKVDHIVNEILSGSSGSETAAKDTLTKIAAKDRVSTTDLATYIGIGTTLSGGLSQISEDLTGVDLRLPSWGLVALGMVALGVLWWIWKERGKYKAMARSVLEDMDG